MSSGSQASRERTYDATTSAGSRISSTLRKSVTQSSGQSRRMWWVMCLA